MSIASPPRAERIADPNLAVATGAGGIRRAPRHVLLGLALMVAFALAFTLLAVRADPAVPVLAVARPVAAGATITDADLTVVSVVADAGLPVVPEAERDTVVGRTAAMPLAAGSLLAPAQLGPPQWPAAGESVIAIPVPGGGVPAGLVAGARVSVLVLSTSTAIAEETARVPATVVEVGAPDVTGAVVVSLVLVSADAQRVAAAGGEVSLVLESPDRGR